MSAGHVTRSQFFIIVLFVDKFQQNYLRNVGVRSDSLTFDSPGSAALLSGTIYRNLSLHCSDTDRQNYIMQRFRMNGFRKSSLSLIHS